MAQTSGLTEGATVRRAGAGTDASAGCINLQNANHTLDKDVVMKANWQIGARLSLADIPLGDERKGRVSLWGRNLTDADELEFTRDLGNGTVIGTFQVPRTYGVDFAMDF